MSAATKTSAQKTHWNPISRTLQVISFVSLRNVVSMACLRRMKSVTFVPLVMHGFVKVVIRVVGQFGTMKKSTMTISGKRRPALYARHISVLGRDCSSTLGLQVTLRLVEGVKTARVRFGVVVLNLS